MDQKQYLLDWILEYLQNKDLVANSIIEIKKDCSFADAQIIHSSKIQNVIVQPTLNPEKLISMQQSDNILIACLNNKENLTILISEWEKLIIFRYLCIYFVNPLSSTEKKWVIFPYTHHRICDENSLKLGLSSMHETVEDISEEQLKSKI